MKKTVALLVALVLMLAQFGAFAEMGVQLISGPEEETEPVSLDDFKLNTSTKIDAYGTLTGTSFEYIDSIYQMGKGRTDSNWGDNFKSGTEADYALLRIDILNDTTSSRNYLSSCTVTAIFDDVYEYGGWCFQYNFDVSDVRVVNDADQYSINPMYTGHYCFGCTLPNAVVESKAPLKMIITLDGNEITYNIRK